MKKRGPKFKVKKKPQFSDQNKEVINIICRHFGITEKELLGQSKIRLLADARNLLAWHLRNSTEPRTFEQIGTLIGGRSPHTIMHYLDWRMELMKNEYPSLLKRILPYNKKNQTYIHLIGENYANTPQL